MRWLAVLFDLIYPRVCAGCGAPVGREGVHLCWDCLASMRIIRERYCDRCGDPVEGSVEGVFECSSCRRRPPAFDRARSVARYGGGLKQALHALKYGGATYLAVDLVPLLVACVETHFAGERPELIAGVPLHAARERGRTYNQSRLLAQGLSWRLGIPHLPNALHRTRSTSTQTHLSAAERRRNVRGAFVVGAARWVEGRRVLLVDDVMTTGATVNECARVLKDAGAARVGVVTVARG